ncbi:MAG: replication protein [Betaproteobacteria bacterium]|nr:MAG: replication protein [Betaproteobacteria bacterium]
MSGERKKTMSTKPAQPNHKKPLPPKDEDFSSIQISLFRDLLCNTGEERDSLANVFDLWDGIPRYSISRLQQDKWRKAGAFPQLHNILFHYRGRELRATIQPAWIEDRDGTITGYYPSANEELIEDVLRKIATDQNSGYFAAKDRRSGVVFTLYKVRKELETRGHSRTYEEINLSLEIMARSVIITGTADGQEGEFTCNSLYLNNLYRVSKSQRIADPDAQWFVDFHPLASRAFDELTYRQFNYARLMSHKSQLARWLDKVLSLKYLNASPLYPFEMRLSTIIRDSKLLDSYGRLRDAVSAVDLAFEELRICQPPLLRLKPDKNMVLGERGKILDVVYKLHPSREFVAEVKAASKRQSLAAQAKPVDKSGGGQGV